jgi:hypothetical protein
MRRIMTNKCVQPGGGGDVGLRQQGAGAIKPKGSFIEFHLCSECIQGARVGAPLIQFISIKRQSARGGPLRAPQWSRLKKD